MKVALFIGDGRDLGLNDETLYLASGVRWGIPGYPNAANGRPPADWSPLYALWYRALSTFVHDRVAVYYTSWTLLVACGTAALYLLQRRVAVSPTVALVVSFFFATSWVYEVWPYPMHFAVAIVLAGTALAAAARSWPTAVVVMTTTFILATYVRPELALAALASMLAWVVMFVRTKRGALGFANFALAALLFELLGNPLGGGRGFYAWGQHYASGVARAEGFNGDPWLRWYELVTRDFGKVGTIGAALRANPSAFAMHVARNLVALPRALFGVTEPLLCGPRSLSSAGTAVVGSAIVVAIVLAIVRLRRAKVSLPIRVLGFATVVVSMAVIGASLIVHPRDHYMIPLVALLATWAGVGASFRGSRSSWSSTLAVAFALVVLAPNRAHGWTPQTAAFGTCRADRAMPVRATIDALRSLGIRRHVVGLELDWGHFFYASLDVDRLVEWQKDEPFGAYVREHHVDIVIISERFFAHPAFGPDSEYRDFVADPRKWGFDVTAVSGSTDRVAVRRDVDPR